MTGGRPVLVDDHRDRVVVRLNRPDVRNAIDQQMVDELHAVCARLEDDPKVAIVVGEGGAFAAGADIAQLRERRRDDALRGINSEIFDRIRRLPMPTVALVEGYALGGGAELAYACDFRIGTPSTRIGNPEVGLGILAAAGAAWRLEELVGEPLAKELLLTGRVLDAQQALDVRLLNEVVEPSELMDAGHRWTDSITRHAPLAVRLTKAVFHAPRDAHPFVDDLAQAVLFETRDKDERMTAFLERRRGGDNRSADRGGRNREGHRPMSADLPSVVGVYGGGRMGAGIAHSFLVSGSRVVVVETTGPRPTPLGERVGAGLAKAAERGAAHRICGVGRRSARRVERPRCAGGDRARRRGRPRGPRPQGRRTDRCRAGRAGRRACHQHQLAVVDAIAADLARPERFLGLHFFNPVPASALVEIVVGSSDRPGAGRSAQGWVAALGKTAITVTDSPGFASSRLGVAIALEAMRMVQEGVASAADIDTAMTLGYRHPMGPLRTTDVVGLDVRLAIAEHLAREVGPRFEPPQILRDNVAGGKLGRKSGQGFYQW